MSRLLSYRQAGELLGDVSESTIRRWVDEGRLPAPVALTTRRDGRPGRAAFVEEEVLAAAAAIVAKARGTTEAA